MSAWHLVVSIAGHHLVPSVLAAAIVWLVLSLLFSLGPVRRPADRVLFLYVGILKAGMAALAGSSISCLAYHSREFGYIALRLPDVVPDGVLREDLAVEFLVKSTVMGTVSIAVLALALVLLVYRWARLAPLYRSIYEGHSDEGEEAARLLRVFEQLVDRAYAGRPWLPRPRLLVAHGAPLPAFCMGVRAPVIVISARVARELGERELKGVLAHELGHVRRMDYLGRWIATIVRDMMIWNPFVILWYKHLLGEQERASDDYASELLDDPVAVASGLVEITACARHLPVVSVGPLALIRSRRQRGELQKRLRRLAEKTAGQHQRTRWHPVPLYALLCAFFAAQPEIVASVPNVAVLASRAF